MTCVRNGAVIISQARSIAAVAHVAGRAWVQAEFFES